MTREEIVEAISNDKMMPFIQPAQLSEIVDFVIKNYKPSIPSNLDEAAIPESEMVEWMKYGPHTNYPWCGIPDAIKITAEHFFALGKQAGAEWMAGQGVTLEGRVCKDEYAAEAPFYYVETENSDDLPLVGDKVVVQIRKK